nr:hypothetical protein [Brevundimonas vesicularis]
MHRLGSIAGGGDLQSHADKDDADQFSVGRGVVGDQHAALGHDAEARSLGLRSALGDLQGDGDLERRSQAGLARDDDIAVHRPRQPPRDRQPQAGAAVEPGRRPIRLRETFEQMGLGLGAHADAGIGHLGRQTPCAAIVHCTADRQTDRALAGELHRIAKQVQQDLSKTGLVAHQAIRHVRRQVDVQRQTLGQTLGLHHLDRLVRQGGRVETLRLQLDHAGFKLGIV